MVVYTLRASPLHLRVNFILGPLAGIFEFVPVVGPAVAAIIITGDRGADELPAPDLDLAFLASAVASG